MEATAKPRLNVSRSLLWEYDFEKFDFVKSADVIIIRILQRGYKHEWHEMIRFYGKKKVNEVMGKTRLLSERDRHFASFYLDLAENEALRFSPSH